MWTTVTNLVLALSCASQVRSVASHGLQPRQEQCASAPNDAAYAACAMQAAFGGSSIVPELLPDFSPQAALSVKYGNVVLGGAQQLSPARVSSQPSLSMSFISNSSQAYQKAYAVIGLSYQAPSTVKLFWLQGAMKVDSNTGAMSSNTTPILKYTSPNPLARTGTNEYIFFIFQDPGLEALLQKSPQAAAISSTAFDLNMFQSGIASRIVAGSYFKSTFDGIPITGQVPAPSPPAQGRQVSSVPQTPPATNTSTNATLPNQGKNTTTQGVSIKPVANETTSTPTQILRPVGKTGGQDDETSSTSSSFPTFMDVQSLRSLFAVALLSIFLW